MQMMAPLNPYLMGERYGEPSGQLWNLFCPVMVSHAAGRRVGKQIGGLAAAIRPGAAPGAQQWLPLQLLLALVAARRAPRHSRR